MERIEPEEQDFDPDSFGPAESAQALRDGVRLFNAGRYHDAHEAFERCWLGTQGPDGDFYKGLVQTSICLHHLERANLEGARKLYQGHRRLLGTYLPEHLGVDLAGLLSEMQACLGPRLRGDGDGPLREDERPRITLA